MLNLKTSFKIIICLSVLQSFSGKVDAKCEMTYEDLDKCSINANIFNDIDFKVPQNEDDLTVVCSGTKKAFECVGTYVRTCMSPFAQTIFGAMQTHAKKDYKERCLDPEGRKDFLKNVQCPEAYKKVYGCVHGYIGQINHQINLHSAMSKEDRISTSCCSISQLHECLLTTIMDNCPAIADYWKSKIIWNEHMENVCGNYNTTQYCDANANPKFWNELKKVFISPEGEGVAIKYKSPVTALIVYMQQKE